MTTNLGASDTHNARVRAEGNGAPCGGCALPGCRPHAPLRQQSGTVYDVNVPVTVPRLEYLVHGPGRVIHEQVGSVAGPDASGLDEDRIGQGPDMQDGRAVTIEEEPPEAGLGRGAHLVESGPENYCLH